ncbi:hypothetical protein [Alkalibacter mobilis]|uniref:hypothetical protein n=1 Tax=Alkalibacter mobilis TaxID=2787712 RepID=UPI00189EE15A|nr:hypothetical protein [Alkalibacter mobilis]MBF7097711.1 hypothetical protein [Alkalibacter mobilis]
MKDVEKLWLLQELESKMMLIEKEAGIHELTNEIDSKKDMYKKIVSSMEKIIEEYKKTEIQIKSAEITLERIEKQINEWEQHLYEGDFKKAKTLNTIQSDLETQRENRKKLKKNIRYLSQQMKNDKLNLKKLKDKSIEVKKEIHDKKKKMEIILTESKDALMSVEKEISDVKKDIETKSLEYYYKKKEKDSPVIVEYRDGVCTGCNMQFSMILGRTMTPAMETRSYFCENCGRIVIVPLDPTLES